MSLYYTFFVLFLLFFRLVYNHLVPLGRGLCVYFTLQRYVFFPIQQEKLRCSLQRNTVNHLKGE